MAKSKSRKLSGVDSDGLGYRKPPQHTQWRQGQSGNPKGRKKGSRNFKTEAKELLNSMVSVVRDGKPAKMSAQRAVLERLCDKALNGDIRALTQLIRLAQEHSDVVAIARGTLVCQRSADPRDLQISRLEWSNWHVRHRAGASSSD
jgi:uncharacterized protein DUF5681